MIYRFLHNLRFPSKAGASDIRFCGAFLQPLCPWDPFRVLKGLIVISIFPYSVSVCHFMSFYSVSSYIVGILGKFIVPVSCFTRRLHIFYPKLVYHISGKGTIVPIIFVSKPISFRLSRADNSSLFGIVENSLKQILQLGVFRCFAIPKTVQLYCLQYSVGNKSNVLFRKSCFLMP